MGEWISVKDKLPDDGDWVLVLLNGDEGHAIAHLDGLFDGKQNWYIVPKYAGAYRSTCTVTHWMPLPEPPKQEGPFKITNDALYISFVPNGAFFGQRRIMELPVELRYGLADWLNEIWERKQ